MATTLPLLSKDIFELAVMDRIDAYAVIPASSRQLEPHYITNQGLTTDS